MGSIAATLAPGAGRVSDRGESEVHRFPNRVGSPVDA